jgi:hypothetical protein
VHPPCEWQADTKAQGSIWGTIVHEARPPRSHPSRVLIRGLSLGPGPHPRWHSATGRPLVPWGREAEPATSSLPSARSTTARCHLARCASVPTDSCIRARGGHKYRLSHRVVSRVLAGPVGRLSSRTHHQREHNSIGSQGRQGGSLTTVGPAEQEVTAASDVPDSKGALWGWRGYTGLRAVLTHAEVVTAGGRVWTTPLGLPVIEGTPGQPTESILDCDAIYHPRGTWRGDYR